MENPDNYHKDLAFYCESCGLTVFDPTPDVNISIKRGSVGVRTVHSIENRGMSGVEKIQKLRKMKQLHAECVHCRGAGHPMEITMRPNPNRPKKKAEKDV